LRFSHQMVEWFGLKSSKPNRILKQSNSV